MNMEASQIIALARKHAGTSPAFASARICLGDAVLLREQGKLEAAKRRALKSLAYSVGVFHEDYQRAAK
jgi:hypothetical protein